MNTRTESKKRVLTGIKPTGQPHIGNYLGAIKPALAQNSNTDAFFFIADYHALTTVHDQSLFKQLSLEVAATWLACGLDPEKVIFYRQSDIPEIFELNWILSCFAPKGLLNRAHAYKALVDANSVNQKDPDKNISMGVFNYPVLMAADILLFNTEVVPVGADQKQHVEIARDIAEKFNHTYGACFTLPEPQIDEVVQTIPGVDGRKMSKNYNNTIPLFVPEKQFRKRIMQIQTDSTPLEEPKDPDSCNLFSLYSLFASQNDINRVRSGYLEGGLGYGTVKKELADFLLTEFAEIRKSYDRYISDPMGINAILNSGSQKARVFAEKQLSVVRKALGL